MRQVRRGAAGDGKDTEGKAPTQAVHPEAQRTTQRTTLRHARSTEPGRGGKVRRLGRVAALAGSCSGRRGSGRWPTVPVTVRCLAAVRSPASTVGTSGGDA